MPIYEFVCKDCRHIFESLCFSSRDVESVRCKRCGSKNVSKLVSTFSSRVSGTPSFGGGFSGGSSCGGFGGFS
ncbi:FmdB family zinc ribbon protein [Thermodesulfatator autotrophicus]|uniref:FmdB family zinc ribbon protein n=1 Tax=Thermodesulfatator autotrophicus TaxID=1795632 RepID=UPI0009EDE595|nr:zinc ribbon domain-containing protein [Thermodesulfatator autotrophicus]